MKKSIGSRFLRLCVVLAFLSALSIVLGKYLAINLGEVIRISLENLPILFAALAFGPLSGIAVGVVADLVGCLLVGYAINPLVTLGGALVGAVAGICRIFQKKGGGVSRYFVTLVSVLLAHLIGSVVVKTIGLSAFYAMDFYILMLWRALNYLLIGIAEATVLFYLLKSSAVRREIAKITKPSASSRGAEATKDGDGNDEL